MKSAVYLETTIISYLAARTSRNKVTSVLQGVTRSWWQTRRSSFDLYISRPVVDELSRGDDAAAMNRLKMIVDIPRLAITDGVISLAERIARGLKLPNRAVPDALHIAVSATGGVDTLLAWNCRHIANAVYQTRVQSLCREAGFKPPVICTPLELMER